VPEPHILVDSAYGLLSLGIRPFVVFAASLKMTTKSMRGTQTRRAAAFSDLQWLANGRGWQAWARQDLADRSFEVAQHCVASGTQRSSWVFAGLVGNWLQA
jgi:hypothetical protein